MFTNSHGENINSYGDEITWSTNTFDGCAVVDRKLKIGDVIEILVEGGLSGGHVVLGITTRTDDQIKDCIRRGTKIDALATTHVKVLKKQARYRLEVNSNNEIVHEFWGKVTRFRMEPGYSFRFCAMLLFGFMDVTIIGGQSRRIQWSPELCGTNVSLSSDKKKVSLKIGNPHAVGAWSDALVQNNNIGFDVSSVNAHWYYMKIFVSPKSPFEAATQGWESFINNELQTVVKIKNPKEQLIITLNDSTLTFVVGVNSVHSYAVNLVSDKAIYLYFELFRVKLKVKAKEDIDVYEDSYSSFYDPSVYEDAHAKMVRMILFYNKGERVENPVLKVKKRGEVEHSERASANLDRLNDVLSNQDTGSSKLSEIYQFIQKFDKDLASVESQYLEPEGARPLPEIPHSQKPRYKPSNISSDSGIGSASSLCSACSPNVTTSCRPMGAMGTTENHYNDLFERAPPAPKLPTLYVRGGNEDLQLMIKDLQKRVSDLERTKKITIASSVDLYLLA
ncbi:hypothetical protein LOTGIDRAFT_169610 [Lottia gigantea]|uniref:Uncharacterized protein n=1 Tax=Lottia gigantea TaxID=225164 RepID=V3ZQP1_LOTGI|nr:hypothetical protein LOTGIDRAFT_169610 [Lottia gigantea]ESO83201.1 hypothetical protein LOTGIDRAFT_169610 [Lottia gigantea]